LAKILVINYSITAAVKALKCRFSAAPLMHSCVAYEERLYVGIIRQVICSLFYQQKVSNNDKENDNVCK